MTKIFEKGDRVNTHLGPGEVVYKRMQAPDYTQVLAYCVKLDNKKNIGPTYNGTIIPADKVSAE